jgi:hypothetical protein
MSDSNKNQNTKPSISTCDTTNGNEGNTPKITNPHVVKRLLTRRVSFSHLRKYCLSPISRKRKHSNICERTLKNDNQVLTNNFLQLSQCELILPSPTHKQESHNHLDNLSRIDSNQDEDKENNITNEEISSQKKSSKKKKLKFLEDDPKAPFIDVVFIESYKKYYSNKQNNTLDPKIQKCACGCLIL